MAGISYGRLSTEQANPRTRKIDRLSIEQAFDLMHREDAPATQAAYCV